MAIGKVTETETETTNQMGIPKVIDSEGPSKRLQFRGRKRWNC
jgi:hypothetical protein